MHHSFASASGRQASGMRDQAPGSFPLRESSPTLPANLLILETALKASNRLRRLKAIRCCASCAAPTVTRSGSLKCCFGVQIRAVELLKLPYQLAMHSGTLASTSKRDAGILNTMPITPVWLHFFVEVSFYAQPVFVAVVIRSASRATSGKQYSEAPGTVSLGKLLKDTRQIPFQSCILVANPTVSLDLHLDLGPSKGSAVVTANWGRP